MTPQERVSMTLREMGLASSVHEFEQSTETAAGAAAAIGCAPGQIVKTLFFLAEGRPTIVLVAGDRQADTAALASLLGVARKKLRMGTPEEVLAVTGYPVGAVPPVGLAAPCDVVVDESLGRFETVWSAAGSGHALFPAPTTGLVAAVQGQWAAITRPPA